MGKMNLMDRAIAAVAPEHALRRAAARESLRFINSGYGNYGLVATKTLGANFATETSKLELDGSVRYDYKGADIISTNSSERFLQNGSSYSNSNAVNKNKNSDVFANFRLDGSRIR